MARINAKVESLIGTYVLDMIGVSALILATLWVLCLPVTL